MKRHRDNRRDSRRDNRRDNRDYTRDDNRDDNRHDSIRNGISDNTHDNGPDSWHDSGRDHLIGRWDDDTRDRRRYGSLRPTTGQGVLWLLGATALWHFCLWPLLHYHFPHYAFPLLNAEGWACLARLADLVGGAGGAAMSVPPPFLDDTLSEEERRYASELPLAPQTVLAENLRILKIRELRLLRRMQALEEGPEAGRWEKSLHSVQDLIRRNVESMAKVARHEKERGAGGEAEGPRTGVLIVPGMMEEDTWARHAKE